MEIPYKNSILIRVPRKKNENDSGGILVYGDGSGGDGMGAIFTRPDSEFLPRRLQAQSGWKFWDMGVLLADDDEETDNLFATDAQLVADITPPGISFTQGDNILPGESADKAAFFTGIIQTLIDEANGELEDLELFPDGPPENREPYIFRYVSFGFKEKFRQITKSKADYYSLRFRAFGTSVNESLPESSGRWIDEETVKFEASEFAGYTFVNFRSDLLFPNAFIGNAENAADNAKVTLEPSFDADEVEFALSPKAEFFFAPAYTNFSFGFSHAAMVSPVPNDHPDGFVEDDSYQRDELLFTDLVTFPRLAISEADFEFLISKNRLIQRGGPLSGAWTLAYYEPFYRISRYFADLPGSEMYYYNRGTISWEDEEGLHFEVRNIYHEGATAAYPNALNFPAPPALPGANELGASIGGFNVSGNGELMMIIFQNNQIYFVWDRGY